MFSIPKYQLIYINKKPDVDHTVKVRLIKKHIV